MNKYIKAEELKEVFRDTEDAEYTRWTLAGVIGEIDDIEAADVEEVIRCKDCINWKDSVPWTTCSFLGGHWEEDMYCSWGEKKNG